MFRLILPLGLGVGALLLGGCFKPTLKDQPFACNAKPGECPTGFTCTQTDEGKFCRRTCKTSGDCQTPGWGCLQGLCGPGGGAQDGTMLVDGATPLDGSVITVDGYQPLDFASVPDGTVSKDGVIISSDMAEPRQDFGPSPLVCEGPELVSEQLMPGPRSFDLAVDPGSSPHLVYLASDANAPVRHQVRVGTGWWSPGVSLALGPSDLIAAAMTGDYQLHVAARTGQEIAHCYSTPGATDLLSCETLSLEGGKATGVIHDLDLDAAGMRVLLALSWLSADDPTTAFTLDPTEVVGLFDLLSPGSANLCTEGYGTRLVGAMAESLVLSASPSGSEAALSYWQNASSDLLTRWVATRYNLGVAMDIGYCSVAMQQTAVTEARGDGVPAPIVSMKEGLAGLAWAAPGTGSTNQPRYAQLTSAGPSTMTCQGGGEPVSLPADIVYPRSLSLAMWQGQPLVLSLTTKGRLVAAVSESISTGKSSWRLVPLETGWLSGDGESSARVAVDSQNDIHVAFSGPGVVAGSRTLYYVRCRLGASTIPLSAGS